MPVCKFCDREIRWEKRGEKNIPLNPDGTDHRCRSNQSQPSQVTQQPSLPGTPVIVGGMTKEMENWITNLVKVSVKQAIKEEFEK